MAEEEFANVPRPDGSAGEDKIAIAQFEDLAARSGGKVPPSQ